MVWCTVAVQTIKVTHVLILIYIRDNSNTSYVMKSDCRLKHYVSADEDDNGDYCLLFINRRGNHRVTQRKQVSPIAYFQAYTLASSCLVTSAWFLRIERHFFVNLIKQNFGRPRRASPPPPIFFARRRAAAADRN